MFLNRNTFKVVDGPLSSQRITGETEQMGAWLDKNWLRSRSMNLSTRVGMTRKESHAKRRNRFANRDRLTVLNLEATFDNVDTRFKGINFATLELSHGFDDVFGAMGSGATANNLGADVRPSRQGGPPSRDFAGGKFNKMFATASRLQTLWPNGSLLARAELQMTSDLLVPMEQYSVGGPDNVRAFPQAQFLFDNALFFSIEYIQNMPFIGDKPAFGNRTWGELVQLSIFYDHVVGNLNEPLAQDPTDSINFKGAGVQLRFTLPGALESRLMFAKEVGSQVYNDVAGSGPGKFADGNGRSLQVWGDITYRF